MRGRIIFEEDTGTLASISSTSEVPQATIWLRASSLIHSKPGGRKAEECRGE
jgi:hypothetical protein